MNDSKSVTPALSGSLNARLSTMMFLQYAIWGAWLPLLWPFLETHRGLDGDQIGTMFAVGAFGAIVAPWVAGQIADRYFSTEKYLAFSHLVGGALVWQLAGIESYWGFLGFALVYSLVYSPTLPLTNSLAFHHLPDRDRDFGRVRVWGTIGWIVVGLGIGQWLLQTYTISDEEAAREVIELNLFDEEARSDLQSRFQVEYTEDDKEVPLVGELTDDGGPVVVVEWDEEDDEGNDTRKRAELEREKVTSIVPMYAVKLAGTDDDGEPLPDKVDLVRAAIESLDADSSEATRAEVYAAISPDDLNEGAIGERVFAGQAAGMADAFRLSAILGILMGLFCFLLPHTPPSVGERKSASAEAMTEIKKNPLLTLFLLAVPISCIHQFYFVHTAGFLGNYQSGAADKINAVFGVGGGGLMTIGQMVEIVVLAAIVPTLAKTVSRKTLLMMGIVAYGLRMALFAFVDQIPLPEIATLVTGIALHGFCFGCFIFVAFMIVDEETTGDVRASAQSLFNLVIIGVGTIVGSKIAGWVAKWATTETDYGFTVVKEMDYTKLFSVPMWGSVGCLVFLMLFYPGGRRRGVGDS